MNIQSTLINLFILFFLGLLIYSVFTRGGGLGMREGMTDGSGNNVGSGSGGGGSGGIGGNVTTYLAAIQAKVIQYQDQLLISKYRTDYESTIIKVNDLVDSIMLETMLSIDPKNPMIALNKLNVLHGAKSGLNGIMKFVDGAK